MAVNESFRSYVVDQLHLLGRVAAKAMFGGVGLYHDGMFFGLIADDILYLKADDSTRADFEAAGCQPFRPYGEGSYSMQYYEVPEEVLEDRITLGDWAHKAVAVARKSATAKKKPPRS